MMVMMIAALFLVGVFAQGTYGIVGGKDSEIIEFPYQVSLRLYGKHICGGTIISDWHILTAGHCVVGIVSYPFTELTIVTSTNTLSPNDGGKVYLVKNIVVHPKYIPRGDRQRVKNDVAVISLKKPIVEDKFQSRIALPTKNTPSGAKAIVSGWGRTQSESKSSIILQKATIITRSSIECLESGERVTAEQICGFASAGIGICKGDSGGPLVYENSIVGIVSTGDKACGQGIPDTYTRVFSFLGFIKDAMQKTLE